MSEMMKGYEKPTQGEGNSAEEEKTIINTESAPEISQEEIVAEEEKNSADYQKVLKEVIEMKDAKSPAEKMEEIDAELAMLNKKIEKQQKTVKADEDSLKPHTRWGLDGTYSSIREPKVFVGRYEGLGDVVNTINVLREKASERGEREKGFFGWLSGERVKKVPEIQAGDSVAINTALREAGNDDVAADKKLDEAWWSRKLPWYSGAKLIDLQNAKVEEIKKACDFANADEDQVQAVFDFLAANKPDFLKTPYYQEKIAAFSKMQPELSSAKGYDKLLVAKEEQLNIPHSVKAAMNSDALIARANALKAEKAKMSGGSIEQPNVNLAA